MTADYYQNNLESTMPFNYMAKLIMQGSQYQSVIYRNGERVDHTTHESMVYAMNHIIQYFAELKKLTK